MKVSILIAASSLLTGIEALQLDFYLGKGCRNAHLGRFDSGFHTCGQAPINAQSVAISGDEPNSRKCYLSSTQLRRMFDFHVQLSIKTEVHFYRSSWGGCSAASVRVGTRGCVTFDNGVDAWQTQFLGTPGKRDVFGAEKWEVAVVKERREVKELHVEREVETDRRDVPVEFQA